VISRLFRTKSIEQILADADHPEHRLKKTLTASVRSSAPASSS
jgi:APA family basic amino acid/polyamine antiporter